METVVIVLGLSYESRATSYNRRRIIQAYDNCSGMCSGMLQNELVIYVNKLQ